MVVWIHWLEENTSISPQYFSCATLTLLREDNFGDLVSQQCSWTFWFLIWLFSTNVDLLGPQLFHFHHDYNVKTDNICHCSDLPHCTRKTEKISRLFFSQNKVFHPYFPQLIKSPLPDLFLFCCVYFIGFFTLGESLYQIPTQHHLAFKYLCFGFGSNWLFTISCASNLFSNNNSLANSKNPYLSILVCMAAPTVLNKTWPVTQLQPWVTT